MKCSKVSAAFVVALAWGCAPQADPVVVPPIDPDGVARRAMELYDRNHDGRLDAEELKASPGLAAAAADLDTDKDGRMTAGEIVARLKKAAASRPALENVIVQVILDGRPLGGASVRFAPDPVMGPAFLPATGRTDENGYTFLRIANWPVPGVFAGYYRVEVFRNPNGRETIPMRYNQQTELGCEVLPTNIRGREIIPTFRLTLRP